MPSPNLPPEVWRFILRYATEVPGLLDTSPLPPLCNDPRPWSAEWFVKSDLATTRKSSLTLVCPQWYSIAIEFLFEYIFIDQLQTLTLLNQCLERSVENNLKAARDSRPLGSHIKGLFVRLDFAVENTLGFTFSFNQLLRLCTDLQCITIRGYPLPSPLSDISALTERAPSLKACIISGTASHLLSSHFPQFCKELQRFNAIAFLSLTFDRSTVSVLADKSITLQNLHTMEINFVDQNHIHLILDMIAHWNLPSLRSLDLSTDPDESDPFTTFFRSHGAKITTLKLQIFRDSEVPVASIVRLCPSVVDLDFDFYGSDEALPSVSELRRITLLGETDSAQASAFDRAMRFIFTNTQPKLECIRLQEVYLQYVGVAEWFEEYFDNWKGPIEKWFGGNNVRLESNDGVLIEIPQLDNEI